jgi:hypothetical protein
MTLDRELGVLDVLAGFGRWEPGYTSGLKDRLRAKYAAAKADPDDHPEGA